MNDNKAKRKLPTWMMKGKLKKGGAKSSGLKNSQSQLDENSPNNGNGDNEDSCKFDTNDMKFIDYSGKIHYLFDFYDVAETFDRLNTKINKQAESEGNDVKFPVSFDMEWCFDYHNGPGKTDVIQICIDTDECYVVHISRMQKIPAALHVFLKNEHIILHGVNIKNDFRKLERDFPFILADPLIDKCVDLRTYYNSVFNSKETWSLASLCAHTLKLQMDKNRAVRASKWSNQYLSEKQLKYAAIDVFVGLKIYQYISSRELENNSQYSDFFGMYEDIAASQEPAVINLDDDINSLMSCSYYESQEMNIAEYEGKIHYLSDFYTIAETFERVNSEINKMAESEEIEKIPVGFSMQFSMNSKNEDLKTAVIIICHDYNECIVVHMSRIKGFPASLAVFLRNEHILLVGCNIKNDLRMLEKDFRFINADALIEKSSVDLGTYYNSVFNKKQAWDLSSMSSQILKLKLIKLEAAPISNFDCEELSKNQLMFCSVNVYVALKIYDYLSSCEKEIFSYSDFFDDYEEDFTN